MTPEHRERFLAEPRVGVVSVDRPGRAPLAVPLWYDYTPGGQVVIWTSRDSLKERLIRAAGRFTITVQAEQPPYRYVSAEGPVTGVRDVTIEDVRALATRYLGDDAEAFVGKVTMTDQVIIGMSPQRWHSMDESE